MGKIQGNTLDSIIIPKFIYNFAKVTPFLNYIFPRDLIVKLILVDS